MSKFISYQSQFILFILCIFILASCSSEVSYSPSLSLPSKLLKKGDIDLQGGIEVLPRARIINDIEDKNGIGLSGQISYGFSDAFSMNARSWIDLDDFDPIKTGYTISGQFVKKLQPKVNLVFIPRAGFVTTDRYIAGYGLSFTTAYHRSFTEKIGAYAALGVIWGFNNFYKEENYKLEENLPMGYAITSNIGISWELLNNFRINAELAPIYQINTFDEETNIVIAPMISFGYTFR